MGLAALDVGAPAQAWALAFGACSAKPLCVVALRLYSRPGWRLHVPYERGCAAVGGAGQAGGACGLLVQAVAVGLRAIRLNVCKYCFVLCCQESVVNMHRDKLT